MMLEAKCLFLSSLFFSFITCVALESGADDMMPVADTRFVEDIHPLSAVISYTCNDDILNNERNDTAYINGDIDTDADNSNDDGFKDIVLDGEPIQRSGYLAGYAGQGQGHSKQVFQSQLVHLRCPGSYDFACSDGTYPDIPPPDTAWTALIQRGYCSFQTKISTAARLNATSVIVYNDYIPRKGYPAHVLMVHEVADVLAVFVRYQDGLLLARLLGEPSCHLTVNMTYGGLAPHVYDGSRYTVPIIVGPIAVLFSLLCIYHAYLRWERSKEADRDHGEQVVMFANKNKEEEEEDNASKEEEQISRAGTPVFMSEIDAPYFLGPPPSS